MKLVPDGYIRRATSTIPFGYELDDNTPNYLKPIEEELDALSFAESMILNEECSLQEACDWLEYKTGRKISKPGLKKHVDKKYNTSLWVSLPDKPGILGDVTSLVGQNEINISSVEMMEKTKTSINFKFNLIISDLKNFTKLLSELKQRQYRFKIIRHTNKKYAFFKKLFKGLKKN